MSGTSLYTVEIAQDFTFNSIFRTYTTPTNSFTVLGTAPEIPVGSYFWRVRRDTSTSNYYQINIQ